MILRATFENILSFDEEVQISFVAGKGTLHPAHVCRAEKRDDISILKAGVIYGANASGKSNIIKAISILQSIALGKQSSIDIEPFKLRSTRKENSKIELEFKVGAKYYAYGVEINAKTIKEEWLFEINDRSDKKVFTRTVSDSGNTYEWGDINGDKTAAQFIGFLGEGTPLNRSFLSEYNRRNGRGLTAIKDVFGWFGNNLKIIFPNTRHTGISITAEKDIDFHQATKRLLEVFNTGIVDIRRFKVKSKEDTGLPEKVIDKIIADAVPGKTVILASPDESQYYYMDFKKDGTYEIFKQKAVHRMNGDDEAVFDMNEESDGTVRILDFIPMLIDLSRNDVVYLIDELDRSMHPMLSYKLLQCYFKNLSGNHQTQLLITTHESNLLDLELLRADEIWFVEKDKSGASRLTSLAEYKPRADVRKGYLQGRYGAVPFFASIPELKWNEQ
jgi:hypothetical protein